MTRTDAVSVLMAGLVDDAGLFPPTALPMAAAVARHRADLTAGSGVLTHRFLCPATRIGELCAHLNPADRFRLGLIADAGATGLAAAVAEIDGAVNLKQASVEFPLARTDLADPAAALDAAAAAVTAAGVPDEVPLFIEPASLSDVDRLAEAVAARATPRPVGVKLRCGGVRSDLFPPPGVLAGALVTVVRAGVAVKATAGLHHAVRYTDPETGFVHHGYLNLLLAVADAIGAAGVDTVADTLRSRDPAALALRAAALDDDAAAMLRRTFVSYGSCSTGVPRAEAGELGLLCVRST
ncbi:MAG: hypothetical protein ACRDQW_15490 [Haloechinothrix sp.]